MKGFDLFWNYKLKLLAIVFFSSKLDMISAKKYKMRTNEYYGHVDFKYFFILIMIIKKKNYYYYYYYHNLALIWFG